MPATSTRPFIPCGSFIDQKGRGGQSAKQQADSQAKLLSSDDQQWKTCKLKGGGYAIVRKS